MDWFLYDNGLRLERVNHGRVRLSENDGNVFREKYPNTEFFLVRIWILCIWIFVFGQKTGKYGLEKPPYLGFFHAVFNLRPASRQ